MSSSATLGTSWPRIGVSAAVFRDGKALLVQRAKPPLRGKWSLPGGHVEPGEPIEQAIRRELDEETGITVGDLCFCDVHEVIRTTRDGRLEAHYVITVFAAFWQSGTLRAASDCADARWVPLTQLADYDSTDRAELVFYKASQLLESLQSQPSN